MRTRYWLESKGGDHSEDLDIDGRIILKRYLKERCVWAGGGFCVMNLQAP
jgi:hypothetical protein